MRKGQRFLEYMADKTAVEIPFEGKMGTQYQKIVQLYFQILDNVTDEELDRILNSYESKNKDY